MYEGLGSGLRRKLPQLQEQSKPILHVPRRGNTFIGNDVEFMQAEAHFLSGSCNPEQGAFVRACDLGANADLAWLLNYVMNDDSDIRESCDNALDDGFDALRARTLARRQRDIVPIFRKNRVDEIWIFFAESSVKRQYGVTFFLELGSVRAIGEIADHVVGVARRRLLKMDEF